MQRCWQDDRALRPKFSELVIILDEMFHFPEETKKLSKVRELNPINPRMPTKIQLTSTKQFLLRVSQEQYLENFQRCGLSNLSNLFQLEAKDLSYSLGIHSQIDQKRITDELKLISSQFNQSLIAQQQPSQSQNSYQQQHAAALRNSNDPNVLSNFNTCLKTLKNNHISSQQQEQQSQKSIFHLIRNSKNIENLNCVLPNSQLNNDLLLFSNNNNNNQQHLAQSFQTKNNIGEHSNGFLV
jgi:hypothetical protein